MVRKGFLVAGAALLTIAAALTSLQVAAASQESPPDQDPALVAAGEEKYLISCSSCHGSRGQGTTVAPPLIGVGAASADFYLRTGRMPLAHPQVQASEREVVFTDEEIQAIVAYVASLGPGPEIPIVDPQRGNGTVGGELYRANCAACHNAAGIGGVLSDGNYAPSLLSVAPTQIAEAMRIGPGQMPVFGPETFNQAEVESILLHIEQLQDPEAPGGLTIGSAGPIPEGFVAVLFGLGALVLLTVWITRSRHE